MPDYKGLAFLQTNNAHDAIINLDWVLHNQPGKVLKAKAQWYLALAYVKEGNREKAAELCSSIVNNKKDGELVKKAEKILDILGK
ncbi:MAG: tetratricopeptide repeat protein [Agriterribacter sp.]